MKNDENCLANYEALKTYIEEHHHLPDKHKVEHRSLLSWAKYQRKRIKVDTMPEEQKVMFDALMDGRSTEHTGGRRPKGCYTKES